MWPNCDDTQNKKQQGGHDDDDDDDYDDDDDDVDDADADDDDDDDDDVLIAHIMKLLCLNTEIQYVNVQVHRHVHALLDDNDDEHVMWCFYHMLTCTMSHHE